MDLELREHQLAVINSLRENFKKGINRQLLYAPTGFGKTEVAIFLMKAVAEKQNRAAMMMDRLVLVDQTSKRLTKYSLKHGVFQAGHTHWSPSERLQVCSAQTMEVRPNFPATDLLIVDECFSGDTLVTTPFGQTRIDKVRLGDAVLNQSGIGTVQAISIKPAHEIFVMEFDDGTIIECTGNHPFFTPSGWKIAREVGIGESFFSLQAVRLLWERVQTLGQEARKRESQVGISRVRVESAADLFNILCQEIQEPDEQSSKQNENEGQVKRNSTQTYQAWRQRAIATFTSIGTSSCAGGGMGGGTCGGNEDEASWAWLSDLLQDRHSQFRQEDWNRGGRRESHNLGSYQSGQEKVRIPYFPRLVNVSHIQRESPIPVFNLQVSGHPSYFANGKLVHNCHIVRKQTVQYIVENPDMKVIGLTATPFTRGLGEIYGEVVTGSTTNDLVTNKWLCPLRVYIAKEIDMTGAKKVAGEWSADEVSERGMKITGDIVSEWQKKTFELFGKPEKTIVFCAGVNHGAQLCEEFAKAGYNFVSISYKDSSELKREAIEDFSRPDTTIHGLIATDILTRGFDVPDVKIGVSARPFSKSLSSHIQQMGRIMRTYPGKDYAVWLDHGGNYLRFQKDWDEVYDKGVQKLDDLLERAKKEPTEKEKKQSKCPVCGFLWPKAADSCPSCGHVKPKRPRIESVAGELSELIKGAKPGRDDKQQFYSELIYYATQRQYNPHWASHKYREKFGVWPSGLHEAARAPRAMTLRWIKEKNIAYARNRRS